ncbi:MAG: cytochrome c [Rhizobiaceae bacterium]
MNKKIIAAGMIAASTLIAAGAFAHGGATGIVKQRMDGMMAMGKALGTVADMFKGKTAFDADQVAAAAKIVEGHAAEMGALFPDTKASREGKGTEALPSIWESKDEFLALASALESKSADLAKVAASNDQPQIRRAFGEVAKTCSACHSDYRKAKN